MNLKQTMDLVKEFESKHPSFSIIMHHSIYKKLLIELPEHVPNATSEPLPYNEFMGHKLYIAYNDTDLIHKLAHARINTELILYLSL